MPDIRSMPTPALLALSLTAAAPSAAQEMILGAGWTGFSNDESAPGALIEGRIRVFSLLDTLDIAAGAAVSIDTDGDLFAGAGPVLRWSVLPRWRIDASFMPGFYDEGAGLDLGGTLEFRSAVAISHALGESWRVGVAYSHISNGGLHDTNPGDDSVWAFVALTL